MSEIDHDFIADRTFAHLNTSIKLADQKASILLSGQLAFIGLYLNFFGATLQQDTALLISSLVVAVCSIAAIVCAGLVIVPRTIDTNDGLFLWESILQRDSFGEYESDVESLNDQALRSEVLKQNYHLAQVATQKYTWLRWALTCSSGMTLALLVSVGIWAV